MMGLFPEIGRAWLTIDSDIYVSGNHSAELTQKLIARFFPDLDV